MTVPIIHPPLTERESACLYALFCFHKEFSIFDNFTSEALSKYSGEPWPATLSRLCDYGLVIRQHGDGGIGYRMTERGFAEHAGLSQIEAIVATAGVMA